VVYADYEDPAYLPGLFADFTRATGVRVVVRNDDDAANVSRVVDKRGSPPADLLLTKGVAGMWTVADEGRLMPLGIEDLAARVPETLRDADGYWTALRYDVTQIVFDAGQFTASNFMSYEDLADQRFAGQLCLSSSELPGNRSLVANLIQKLGERPAEIVVRGWMANLALPPFKSEAQLRAAVAAGTCRVAILSSNQTRVASMPNSIGLFTPARPHLQIEAVGINRHAGEPDSARRLLEWLLSNEIQGRHAAGTSSYAPSEARNGLGASDITGAIWHLDEAVKLAERAAYR
jgi:iron(III) transport system substrate-binding protein